MVKTLRDNLQRPDHLDPKENNKLSCVWILKENFVQLCDEMRWKEKLRGEEGKRGSETRDQRFAQVLDHTTTQLPLLAILSSCL
jgi:hypothetical protein